MTFPSGFHRDVWEAIGAAIPATELDRTADGQLGQMLRVVVTGLAAAALVGAGPG